MKLAEEETLNFHIKELHKIFLESLNNLISNWQTAKLYFKGNYEVSKEFVETAMDILFQSRMSLVLLSRVIKMSYQVESGLITLIPNSIIDSEGKLDSYMKLNKLLSQIVESMRDIIPEMIIFANIKESVNLLHSAYQTASSQVNSAKIHISGGSEKLLEIADKFNESLEDLELVKPKKRKGK